MERAVVRSSVSSRSMACDGDSASSDGKRISSKHSCQNVVRRQRLHPAASAAPLGDGRVDGSEWELRWATHSEMRTLKSSRMRI